MSEKELKKGKTLFQIVYWEYFGRKMETLKIQKVNPQTVKIAGYEDYYLHKNKIGVEWFLSKEEAIKNSIKVHKEQIIKYHGKKGFQQEITKKEIRSLNTWLKRLANQRVHLSDHKRTDEEKPLVNL